MQKNFKLVIEYDGSAYHGWQRQSNDKTIQGTIENALETLTQTHVSLIGSGRTDAGVHALGQVANFHCDTTLTPRAFLAGLNSLLPGDIVIKSCTEVDDDFHARYHVKSKIYEYRILNRNVPSALYRQFAWFIRKPLDPALMKSAMDHLIGIHDFKAFEGSGSPRYHTTRCVQTAGLTHKNEDLFIFGITANGFLRFMVRNIVGTLVEVGLGKRHPDDIKAILQSKDRNLAGATAPPHGLFLKKVAY